jgi:hypothetical protein
MVMNIGGKPQKLALAVDLQTSDTFLVTKHCSEGTSKDICKPATALDTNDATDIIPTNNSISKDVKVGDFTYSVIDYKTQFCFPDQTVPANCIPQMPFLGITHITTPITGYDGMLGLGPKSNFLTNLAA